MIRVYEPIGQIYGVTSDYEFSSPSAAAAILLGRPSNGNDEWRTETGVKLKDIDK